MKFCIESEENCRDTVDWIRLAIKVKGVANINRLLFVVSQLSTGGAERVISLLANNFALRGYEVHLVNFWMSRMLIYWTAE